MFERFTEKSRRALFFARYFATEKRCAVMQPEHLLEGVLESSPGSVSEAAATVEVIRQRLSMAPLDTQERPTLHEIIFSPAVTRALEGAVTAADGLGHRPIRPEHLLLALLADEQSAASQALRHAGVERGELEARAGRSDEQIPDPVSHVHARRHVAAGPQATARFAILHDCEIAAPPERVFDAVSLPAGLDEWWTFRSSGTRAVGSEYHLDFGPTHDWRALVTACRSPQVFELLITRATEDWQRTRVTFELDGRGGKTELRLSHVGWPAQNDQYRRSAYAWAMYLRILRRHLEHGESVPYKERLDA